jgi:hypothetical protein
VKYHSYQVSFHVFSLFRIEICLLFVHINCLYLGMVNFVIICWKGKEREVDRPVVVGWKGLHAICGIRVETAQL